MSSNSSSDIEPDDALERLDEPHVGIGVISAGAPLKSASFTLTPHSRTPHRTESLGSAPNRSALIRWAPVSSAPPQDRAAELRAAKARAPQVGPREV